MRMRVYILPRDEIFQEAHDSRPAEDRCEPAVRKTGDDAGRCQSVRIAEGVDDLERHGDLLVRKRRPNSE